MKTNDPTHSPNSVHVCEVGGPMRQRIGGQTPAPGVVISDSLTFPSSLFSLICISLLLVLESAGKQKEQVSHGKAIDSEGTEGGINRHAVKHRHFLSPFFWYRCAQVALRMCVCFDFTFSFCQTSILSLCAVFAPFPDASVTNSPGTRV